MACEFAHVCNFKLQDKRCYSCKITPMCNLRLKFKKEKKRQKAIEKGIRKCVESLPWANN